MRKILISNGKAYLEPIFPELIDRPQDVSDLGRWHHRFKLTDLGPDKDYGFEQAQGGPPDDTAEDMMVRLYDRARGLRLAYD